MERPLKRTRALGILIAVIAGLGACGQDATAPAATEVKDQENSNSSRLTRASMELFFDVSAIASNVPERKPLVYEIEIDYPAPVGKISRRGDLPTSNGKLLIDDLLAGENLSAVIRLYAGVGKAAFSPEKRTHSCRSEAHFDLAAGETSTIGFACLDEYTKKAVSLFSAFTQLSAELKRSPTSGLIEELLSPDELLFAAYDEKHQRISLRKNMGRVELFVSRLVDYRGEVGSWAQLMNGEEVSLNPVGGIHIESLPQKAVLKLEKQAFLVHQDNSPHRVVLPLSLENTSKTLSLSGSFLQEDSFREITVAAYNVENLFDQKDDAKNEGYGDYRLEKNSRGYWSNWGEKTIVDGVEKSFTEVKIDNIKKVLSSIALNGPDVVALQEIENADVLEQLRQTVEDLGYQYSAFTDWPEGIQENAVGLAFLSKHPITEQSQLRPPFPEDREALREPIRPILRIEIDVQGHRLSLYNNHWKSKGGPESYRRESAKALRADIDARLARNSEFDFVVLGDLNSDYNEAVIIDRERHDDTNGLTGINHDLLAQGNELYTVKYFPRLLYNLYYELNRVFRKSSYHRSYGWSSFDHMIIGNNLYDQTGFTYVDNSFNIARPSMKHLSFLFDERGNTLRWKGIRNAQINGKTTHMVGGYSDHLPLWARLRIPVHQSPETIKVNYGGKADRADPDLRDRD